MSDHEVLPVYATLHFYYGDPDSMRRYRLCNNAEYMMIALYELDRWLRNEIKYNDKEELSAARDQLMDLCDEYEIDLLGG